MHHLHFRLLPILVAALIQWMLGALWYSPPLFAGPWMKLLKVAPEGPKTGLAAGMVASLLGDLVLSLVLVHVILWAGAYSFAGGMFAGFMMWLGFMAAPLLAQGIYEQRPFLLFVINNGYWLIAMLLTGGLLAIWH